MSIRRLFRLDRRRADVPREVDDELAFHMDMRVDALVRQGWNVDDARTEAARQFGNLDEVRGSCISLDHQRERAMHRISFVEEFAQDVRYALRVLRRSPGFAVAVILVLSLGIGANTAIFSLADAVLRRPLPVEHPERLLAIGDPSRVSSMSQGDVRTDLMSYPMYKSLQSDSIIGSNLLASGRPPRLDIRLDSGQVDVEHARGRLVSANYFRVLGIRPAYGRVFNGTEDQSWGSSPFVVISDAYWNRRFKRDPKVIGKNITINNAAFTIVGVTPETFTGEIVGTSNDMWIPVSMQGVLSPNQQLYTDKTSSWLLGLLRVPQSHTMAQADQLMRAKVTRWVKEQQNNANNAIPELYVSPGDKGFSRTRRNMAAPLAVLMMGVGLLLLLVCANVANLLLARAVSRAREISVRLAIGARRSRLIRQLMAESVVLAVFGAIGGLGVSWYATKLLLRLANEGGTGALLVLKLDPPVLIFTGAVALVSVVFFGIAPALHASRVNLSSAMRGNTVGAGSSRIGRKPGLSQLLVAGQVALSLTLLVSAGLLARDLRYLQQIDTGLDRDHVLTLEIDATGAGIDSTRLVLLADALRKEMATVSDVTTVSYSENGIFGGQESTTTINVPGYEARKEGDLDTDYDAAGPDYVKSIGARLIAGRDLSAEDVYGRQEVALVNEAFVKKFMPGKNAIDATFKTGKDPIRIVGVIADVRDHTLSSPPTPRFYIAYAQRVGAGPRALRMLVHTSGNPALALTPTRAAIRRVNPVLVVEDALPVSVRMENSIGTQRLLMRMALIFGALALTLAAIGLYGVMSYVVSRRTSEIGLRMALGARRSSVVWLVLFDALRLVMLGVFIGLPLSMALARLLGKQLHGVSAMDPLTLTVSLIVLTASAGAAALAPALRASRVAPLQAIGRG